MKKHHEKSYMGDTNEWYTPHYILDELDVFDLDPCSPVKRLYDTASQHYNITHDGLSKNWTGRVYLNPPYGPKTKLWLKKMSRHNNGIALIFARTETKMFHRYVFPVASALLFLRKRVQFVRADGYKGMGCTAPSVLVAYNAYNANVLRNCNLSGCFLDMKHSVQIIRKEPDSLF